MDMAYILGGSYPHIASVRIGETVNAGVPLVAALDGESGAQQAATDGAVDCLGVCQEDLTYSTTQATDGSDLDRLAKVIINPDAVWKTKLSGDASDDTLLPVLTVDTADSTGVSVETGEAALEFDNGTIWGLTGGNKGQVRKVDEITGNHFSVLVPFLAIAVGDTFLASHLHQFGPTQTAQLTTSLKQINSAVATAHATDVEVVCVDLLTNGRGDSFALILFDSHVLGGKLS